MESLKNIEDIKKYVVLDTETTGLDVIKDGVKVGEIAQLSYILVNERLRIEKAKNFYFNVKEMPENVSRINNLTKEKLLILSGGKTFKEHSKEIYADLKGRVLVGHKVSFDYEFLFNEFRECGFKEDKSYIPDTYCTMQNMTPFCNLSRKDKLTGEILPKWPKLSESLDYWNIAIEIVLQHSLKIFGESKAMHDSRFDSTGALLVFKKLKEREMKK